jgi:hypothetical protein
MLLKNDQVYWAWVRGFLLFFGPSIVFLSRWLALHCGGRSGLSVLFCGRINKQLS